VDDFRTIGKTLRYVHSRASAQQAFSTFPAFEQVARHGREDLLWIIMGGLARKAIPACNLLNVHSRELAFFHDAVGWQKLGHAPINSKDCNNYLYQEEVAPALLASPASKNYFPRDGWQKETARATSHAVDVGWL